MEKWEYKKANFLWSNPTWGLTKVNNTPVGGSLDGMSDISYFNQLGSNGWELVNFYVSNDYSTAIFKRILQ
jgi:hypothetical protein